MPDTYHADTPHTEETDMELNRELPMANIITQPTLQIPATMLLEPTFNIDEIMAAFVHPIKNFLREYATTLLMKNPDAPKEYVDHWIKIKTML